MSDLHILMEYYQGNSKDKRFKICEEQLKKIIEKLKPEQDLGTRYNITRKREVITSSAENKLLCSTLADIFNMKDVNIYWSRGSINAMTLPPTVIGKTRNMNNLKGKGKLNPIPAHIILYEDLITRADLNEKELMAVILHEIGHNYYFTVLRIVPEIFKLTFGIPMVAIMRMLDHTIHVADDFVLKYFPTVTNVMDAVTDIKATTKHFLGLDKTMKLLVNLINGTRRLATPSSLADSLIGLGNYQEEKSADMFAARFGYGAAQVSALSKFDYVKYSTSEQLIGDTIFATPYYLINDANSTILNFFLAIVMEPHPTINVRYHTMKRKLERDLTRGDYPPEYKQELQDQIYELEKMYNILNTIDPQDRVTITKSVYKTLDTLTKNRPDWREIFNGFVENSSNF